MINKKVVLIAVFFVFFSQAEEWTSGPKFGGYYCGAGVSGSYLSLKAKDVSEHHPFVPKLQAKPVKFSNFGPSLIFGRGATFDGVYLGIECSIDVYEKKKMDKKIILCNDFDKIIANTKAASEYIISHFPSLDDAKTKLINEAVNAIMAGVSGIPAIFAHTAAIRSLVTRSIEGAATVSLPDIEKKLKDGIDINSETEKAIQVVRQEVEKYRVKPSGPVPGIGFILGFVDGGSMLYTKLNIMFPRITLYEGEKKLGTLPVAVAPTLGIEKNLSDGLFARIEGEYVINLINRKQKFKVKIFQEKRFVKIKGVGGLNFRALFVYRF